MYPTLNPVSCYGAICDMEALERSLALIKDAIKGEKEDEMFYEYLISIAPTREAKDIIASIRDDEKRHNKTFRRIYGELTGEQVMSSDEFFDMPMSYIDGLKKALFGELGAVVKYRQIKEGLPMGPYQDKLFNIITDEIRHSAMYNYLITMARTAAYTEMEENMEM